MSYSRTAEHTDPNQWLKRIRFYTGILEELAKQYTVTSIERISYKGEIKQNGVDYRFIQLDKDIVRFPLRMHRIVKDMRPDVVLVNGFVFPLQIIQLRLKLGKAVKIIVLHRAEKPGRGLKKILQQLADRVVDAYLFVSDEFRKQWQDAGIIGRKEKIFEVIQSSSVFHPVSQPIARTKTGVEGSPVFLWVGRLDKNKDPLTVVRAFKKFLLLQPTANLYMIYQDACLLEELRELAEGEKRIKLVGKIEHEELCYWYSSADFFISGSHYEGSGIALCEAMSCGCIPIVTNIISFRRMTGPGKCGMLYGPGDEKDLLTTLQKAWQTDRMAEKEKTLKQFEEELSFAAIAKKIRQVINSLSKEKK